MPNCLKYASSWIFADDSNLIISGHNLQEILLQFNEDLHNISTYCKSNFLFINPKKSKAMIISKSVNSSNATLNIILNGDKVEIVDKFKFLGFHINNELN